MSNEFLLKRLVQVNAAEKALRTDDERRQMEAAFHGKHCGKCGHVFDAGEPVYILQLGHKIVTFFDGVRTLYKDTPTCKACGKDSVGKYPVVHGCMNCGRRMIGSELRYCCTACQRQRATKLQKQRRHMARKLIACASCGQQFTPKRTDAVTCSPACRQKAYRRARPRASMP